MVTLRTNKSEYENDIAEIIRAFCGFTEIRTGEHDGAAEYELDVSLQDDIAYARGKNGGTEHRASYPIECGDDNSLLRKRREKRALKIVAYEVMRALEPSISLPWGALTGIRPTKLLRELIETEGESEALRFFTRDFDVKPEKTALAKRIVDIQRQILDRVNEKHVDIYIGIPFCKTRCLYCSFASEVAKDGVPKEYLDTLHQDIRLGAEIVKEGGYTVRSMYVGGGTPTVLSASELFHLLDHALTCYGGTGEELTVEAGRPDTVDEEKLKILVRMGVNRISLNPQSMNADTLERIGRMHSPEQLISAFRLSREVGIKSINMDVIAGLPGECPIDMARTLEKLIELSPDNLTVHTLAVKRSSRLKERIDEYELPSPAEAERMTAMGADVAKKLSMRPYYMYRQKYMRGNLENVGYAKEGKECVYNIDMMEEAVNIIAHGAGAMTKRVYQGRDIRVERIPAPKDIGTYIGKLNVLNVRKRELFL